MDIDAFVIDGAELRVRLVSPEHCQVEWARLGKPDADLWVGVFDSGFLWVVSSDTTFLEAVAGAFTRVSWEDGDHQELWE